MKRAGLQYFLGHTVFIYNNRFLKKYLRTWSQNLTVWKCYNCIIFLTVAIVSLWFKRFKKNKSTHSKYTKYQMPSENYDPANRFLCSSSSSSSRMYLPWKTIHANNNNNKNNNNNNKRICIAPLGPTIQSTRILPTKSNEMQSTKA